MKNVVIILILITLSYSCTSRFEGYDDLGDDVYMKLLSFEESQQNFKEIKYVKAEISLNIGEEILYHNFSDIILPLNNPFKKLIQELNEGDSALFIVGKESFQNDMLNLENRQFDFYSINIKVYSYYTEEEFKIVKVEQDEELIEQLVLNKYLKQMNITAQHKKNGVYVIQHKKGEGKSVKQGDKVVLNYKAYFTNEIEFDNTYKDIAFTLGEKGLREMGDVEIIG